MHEQTFSYLVFGLAKYLDRETKYPLPDELRFALNQLAYTKRADYPRTFAGALQMMSMPLQTWWSGALPAFDPEASLIYDNALSVAANEYLDELFWLTDLPPGVSTENFQLALDKLYFKQMLMQLRNQAVEHPDAAQAEYVTLRRFLILHPWPTIQDIVDEFSSMQYVRVEDVGELYAFADSMQSRHMHQGQFWNCVQCGPLILHRNELCSIKPSVCGQNCPRHTGGWIPVSATRQRRVLKQAHHLSILIPGIPELALLDWLQRVQKEYSSHLIRIEPWPGIDYYDIRIVFNDGDAWAVDIKDYTDPVRLEAALTRPPNDGAISWERAFYVFPSHRLEQRNRYREAVDRLPAEAPT